MNEVQMRLGDVVMYGDSPKPPAQRGCFIVFNKLLGWWDGVGGTGETKQREFADGAWITPDYDEARTIVVEGHIWADDQPTLRDGIAWFKSQIPRGDLGFFVATEHEQVSHVLVRRDGRPDFPWDGGLSADFSIQLIAPDARKLGGDGSAPYQHSATAFLPSTSGGLRVLGAEVLRTNLATNPSFESGVAGWSTSRGTMTRVAHPAAIPAPLRSGTFCAQVTSTGTGTTFSQMDASGQLSVVGGDTFRASATAYSADGQASVGVLFYNSSGSYAGESWATATTTAALLTVTVTVPANAVTARVGLRVYGPTGGNPTAESAYFDCVTTALGTYFDGDTPNTASRTYAWSGAPNDSASTESSVGGIQAPFQITASVVNGSVTVTAQCDAPPPVLVRINGPVVQPIIRDELGGQMPLDISLSAGQWLDVDLDARTIKINSTVNRRNLLRGPWITPRPGMVLSLDAAVYNPATSMTVFWTDASN